MRLLFTFGSRFYEPKFKYFHHSVIACNCQQTLLALSQSYVSFRTDE